jgi:hypothetical protein
MKIEKAEALTRRSRNQRKGCDSPRAISIQPSAIRYPPTVFEKQKTSGYTTTTEMQDSSNKSTSYH